MANLIKGFELIDAWTDQLNEICRTDGGLERDDTARIWNPWLHQLTTEEWCDIHHALDTLRSKSPASFNNSDLDILLTTRNILDTKDAQVKTRVMDTKDYKRYAWRQMCSMREVVNRYNGVDIANNPPSRHKPADVKTSPSSDKPTPEFNNLFH
jgi:hypothetical protein